MLGSVVLDVAIGLVVVYLLLSLVCSAIREGIESFLKTRATHLERGLRELLNDRSGTGMTRAIYSHPLICGLFQGDYDPAKIGRRGWMPVASSLPSYIPSASFATALLDIVARGPDSGAASAAGSTSTPITLGTVRAQISTIANPPVQRALLTALDTAQGDLQRAQANVEAWYDSTMERVSGWYKRKSQFILFALGLFVAVVGNVDTLQIARFLYEDKPTRDALVAEAESVARDPDAVGNTQKVIAGIRQMPLPIGWNGRPGPAGPPGSFWDLAAPVLGWLTTALAISLGAPFWFDVLKRVMEIRATVKPRDKPDAPPPGPPAAPVATVAAPGAPSAETLFRPNEWSSGPPREGVL